MVWVVGSLNVDIAFEVEHLVEPGQTILSRAVTWGQPAPGGNGMAARRA